MLGSITDNINWGEIWLLPYKYHISNKVKEVKCKKKLYIFYPVNTIIAIYMVIADLCTFLNHQK